MPALKNALILAAAVLALVPACTDVARRTTVPVNEYADYRRFHLADTAETKLGAAYQYLKSHQDGAYRREVTAWLARGSAVYVRSAWNDPRRLEAFLAEVPTGSVSEKAVVRLVELTVHSEYRDAREKALDERASLLTKRLAAAEEGRRALVVGVAGWAKRLAAIRNWGARTSELDSDFIFHFRLTEPAARCTDTECLKPVAVSFAVPEGKEQSEREAIYDVGLRLENGGVRAAWISGSELFTRIGEAVSVAAVSPSDLVGRAEAISQASQVIELAIEASFPAARCTVEPVSPVVLHRRCDGVELRVVSAVELGDEDRVVVAPVPAALKPGTAAPPAAPPP